MRILRDPTPVEGGGQVQAAPPQQQPPATQTPPATQPYVQVDASRYDRMVAAEQALARITADQAAETQRLMREKQDALAAKGEGEKALKEARESYERTLAEREAALERIRSVFHSERRANALNEALASAPAFVSEAARAQFLKLVEARFEVVERDGSAVVQERIAGRAVRDVMSELTKSAEYAHYFAAQSSGGTGRVSADMGSRDEPPKQPSIQDQIIENWKNRVQDDTTPKWARRRAATA